MESWFDNTDTVDSQKVWTLSTLYQMQSLNNLPTEYFMYIVCILKKKKKIIAIQFLQLPELKL